MMRTERLVLLERLQPLHDFLLHGRAVTLQQVYESGLTWQPNLSVLKSNRLHLSGGTLAHLSAKASRFPPVVLLIGIPRISTKAGKAGSSWRFGSGWQLSDLTPSCSPKTPPCRRDLFVTCFASEPARRAEPSPQTFDVGSNPRTGKVELFAETVRLPLSLVRFQLCRHTHPGKAPARGWISWFYWVISREKTPLFMHWDGSDGPLIHMLMSWHRQRELNYRGVPS